MAQTRSLCALVICLFLVAGCKDSNPESTGTIGGSSDAKKVEAAEVSILFFGNSHTGSHNLPKIICDMIQFRKPGTSVYSHHIFVGFLEDAAKSPTCLDEIEKRSWKHVVLQAQKISTSGKFEYSRKEGIELARSAKRRGMAVHFYPEWGMKGVEGDGDRLAKIYSEMARDAEAGIAPVSRAWDLALAERPEIALHSADGNHQSEIGAFLTACVLYATIMGDDPASLASFPYSGASEADRKFLATIAAKSLKENVKRQPK